MTKPLQCTIFQRATKGLCNPRSRFWICWGPRLLILSMFLCLGWMVALAFLVDDRFDFLEDSTLVKSLQESQVLAMAHCALVGSAIPMLLDVFLDLIKLKLRKGATDEVTLVHFKTRALLLICSLISTIVYAYLQYYGNDADLPRLAFIYVLSGYTFRIIILTTVALLIMKLRIIPNLLALTAFIPWYTVAPLRLIHLLRPEIHSKFFRISYFQFAQNISYFLFVVCLFVWARDLWRRYKESRWKSIKLEPTEFICILYVTIFVTGTISILVFYGRTDWRNATEDELLFLVLVKIVCVVPMTIIPGRISSADAQSRLQMLSQKQAFVRFVSHEIRSPLSIVAAGLEILVERLNEENTTMPPPPSAGSALDSAPAAAGSNASSNTSKPHELANDLSEANNAAVNPKELLELANDLSEATDTAINILNDLLQYESMDAGMFKLEAARMEPADLFKAKALAIIAKRHSLALDVVPPMMEDGVFVLADVYRIDQVVRNLVTNACKFTPAGGTIAIEAEVSLAVSAVTHSSSSSSCGSNTFRYGAHHLSTPTPLEESVASFAGMHAIRCGSLRVKVSDTGIGIQEHNKNKLFQQFEQFDKNQLQSGGGSGLGLWISHYIVDCHGGKLQFESLGPGKGSVFFFDLPLYQQQQSMTTCPAPMLELPRLPITSVKRKFPATQGSQGGPTGSDAEANEDAGAATGSLPRPHAMAMRESHSAPIQFRAPDARMSCSEVFDHGASSATHGTAPKKISFLLVDDSKGNRRMLRRMLESEASVLVSSIQEAEDGVDAVALVREAGSAIDCIFMDSVMKQMHGPETVRHLREKLGFTGKILGLTGNAMEDDVKHFQQAGLDLLLIKPLKKARLVEALLAHGLMPAQPVTPEALNERALNGGRTAVAGGDFKGDVVRVKVHNDQKNDGDNNCDAENDKVIPGAPKQQNLTSLHHIAARTTLQTVWNCPFD